MHKLQDLKKFTPYYLFLFFFNLFSNLRKEKKKNTKKKNVATRLGAFKLH